MKKGVKQCKLKKHKLNDIKLLIQDISIPPFLFHHFYSDFFFQPVFVHKRK